ncbi:MAG: C10 family peptidase [Bacteroidales bacterium]|nr:C10 family peptidase [Bacteroidales bacterium]
MKKLFFVWLLLGTMVLMAAPVNPNQARKVALNFMRQTNPSGPVMKNSDGQLLYIQTDSKSGTALFYVFQVGNGFVMVAADDAVKPILGYSVTNSFPTSNMPVNMRSWIKNYGDEIQYVISNSIVADKSVRAQWENVSSETGNQTKGGAKSGSVAPLLKTTWNQWPYYNKFCPGTGDDQAPTGCEATAMAQIINYYEYPAHGKGTHRYTPVYETYGEQFADFGATTYQYSLMPNELNENSSEAQVDAVATLMYHCGVALAMDYRPTESGAYTEAARVAFINHFNYDAQSTLKTYKYTVAGYGLPTTYTRVVYEDDEWIQLLKDALDEEHPILYSGSSGKNGHAFVCDGYDANDYFHINWGWGGSCDGYFAIGALNPNDDYAFNDDNEFVVASPRTQGQEAFMFNISGTTTQKVGSSVMVGHPRAFNDTYKAYPTFSNQWQNTLVLYPEQDGNQLLLEVLNGGSQSVSIYDGVGTEGSLLATSNGEGISKNVVASTQGALTMVFSSKLYSDGFMSRVSQVECEPVVINFHCEEKDHYSATLAWDVYQKEDYPNHQYNWCVEYGPQGFIQGTGTKQTASEMSVDISGLNAETSYDAYLTYTCTGGQSITVGPCTFKTERLKECMEPIGTSTIRTSIAFNPYKYSWSQQIFTAEELKAIGLQEGDAISSLSLQCIYLSSQNSLLSVYMGHTTKTAFANESDLFALQSLTNVYPEKETYLTNTSTDYWLLFEFATPFVWDGKSNVVVALTHNSSNGGWSGDNFYSHNSFTNSTLYNSDGQLETGVSGTLTNQRTNIKFCIEPTCMKPANLTYTILSRSKVRLDWQPGYQETAWNVEYGPKGFARGEGKQITVSGTPSVELSQLSMGEWDAYVQADCGGNSAQVTFQIGLSDCAQIGDGTSTDNVLPMGYTKYYGNELRPYTWTQQLYTAQELTDNGLTAGDDIASIAFEYAGDPQQKSPVTVYLTNTNETSLNSQSILPEELVRVFHGAVSLAPGWVTIVLDAPFQWTGGSLAVTILNNSGTENETFKAKYHYCSQRMTLYATRSTPMDIYSISPSSTEYRNNMRFCSSKVNTLRREMEVAINEGDTYDFYGKTLSEQGTYYHRWYIDEANDSLVTLNLKVRKIIYVTTTGSGAKNGTSWANAMDLQMAMDTAATFTDVTPYLYVKKGTYTGNTSAENSFVIKPNVRAYGGFAGTERADFNLESRNLTANQTILFGSNARRVLYQSEEFTGDQASLFDGFTIRGGTVNTVGSGGGAYIRKGCTLNNCIITANNAAISGSTNDIRRYGVAVYNLGGTLSNCEIHNNSISLSGTGSNYYVYGVGVFSENGTVVNCNIHDNKANYDGTGSGWNAFGGGIYISQSSFLDNNMITHNTANSGGGLYVTADRNSDPVTLSKTIVANNTSRTTGGGMNASTSNASFNVTDCLIANNSAGTYGGGVYDEGNVIYTGCNIVRNAAVTNGGGIYSHGGTMNNSILWGNKVGVNANQYYLSSNRYFTMNSSAVQGGYSGAITLKEENSGSGIGYPMFANPTEEAGVDVNNAIGDWTLQPGSICINMGNNRFASGTDLAGENRIQQERVDIGAYESNLTTAFPVHPEEVSNIIYVTTTGAGARDGSSWGNALGDLQYAMAAAAGNKPASTVWVAQGTYTSENAFVVQPKVAVYGSFVGNEPYNYDLSKRDFAAHATVLDGETSHRVLDKSCPFNILEKPQYLDDNAEVLMPVTGTRTVTACSGVLYDDGGKDANFSSTASGEIILRSYNPNSTITLSGSYNTGDTKRNTLKIYQGEGGALLKTCYQSGNLNLTVEGGVVRLKFEVGDDWYRGSGFEINFSCSDCEVSEQNQLQVDFRNDESLFDGITIQNGKSSEYGGAYLYDNTDMLNCTFKQNESRAVYAQNCNLTNCTFADNTGYGLYGKTVNVNNCVIENNANDYAAYLATNSQVTNSIFRRNDAGLYINTGKVSGCTFSDNGTRNYGLYSYNANIINSSVINNQGGGLYANGGLYVNVNVANNTTTEAYSYDRVGGVFARNQANFVNCNIVNNKATASDKAGVVNYSTNNEYTNCIIWGNKGNNGIANINGESTFSYSAIEGGYEGIQNITLEAANSGSAAGAYYVDFIKPTAEAGVTTQTNYDWRPNDGSACINKGNPNTTSLNLPLYDLAGSLRVKQQRLDIGAYEYGDVIVENIVDSTCFGESFFYGDYFVHPEKTGLFLDTFVYNNGVEDYIAYINLKVNEVYNINIEESICEGDSYKFNGESLSETGTYETLLQSVSGCDSLVVLNLTVNPIVYHEFEQAACDEYVWNGEMYDKSGDYTQTLQASTGCDSVVTMHLTINHPNSYEFDQQACVTYIWNGEVYDRSGDYVQTLTNAAGCDSVVTMHLTIVDVITNEIEVTACDVYTWNDQLYTRSGDYWQRFDAANGCDSIVTMHLTIHKSNSFEYSLTACDVFDWAGEVYRESGIYQKTFTNAAGCDSVVTLHLTINKSTSYQFADETCDEYIWNGVTYRQSGTYVQTLTNAVGCDSVVTLHLTLYNSVVTDESLTICESELPYQYKDTLFETGTPYLSTHDFHYQTVHGCDSTVRLQLTIIPAFVPEVTVTGTVNACESGTATLAVNGTYASYLWSTGATKPSIEVTTAGYYWATVTDDHGCQGTSEMLHLGESELIDNVPAIRLVGVENGHNVVVWNAMADPDVKKYKLYRENDKANVYEPLAVVDVNPETAIYTYEDVTADPSVRAYRYKMTAMDECDGETALSELHKTLHLTINKGLGNSWNLIWTPYEGFEFESYRLYRGTANNNLQLIQTMPSNLTSFTDQNPGDGALFYQIEVVLPESAPVHTKAGAYTSSRSNIVYNGIKVQTAVNVKACESYDWDGQHLTASGDYTRDYQSVLGYDSTVTLHLTIYHRPEFTISGNTQIIKGQSTTLSVPSNAEWTYLWSTGAVTRSITVSPDTTTAYRVTVTNGPADMVNGPCAATAGIQVVVTTTGIEDAKLAELSLYPNPTTDKVIIRYDKVNHVTVYDMAGQMVAQFNDQTELNLSTLSAGVYTLRIETPDGVAVRKVVKQTK